MVRGGVFSCFNLERGRGRAADEAEDHMKCKKRSGMHLARALLLNALPVPLLRQVFKSISESEFQRSGLPSRRFRMEILQKTIIYGSRL